jgi:proline dehydrogenase
LSVLRPVLLRAADSDRVRQLVETAPVSREVVRRFVAGARVQDAVAVARGLADQGLAVTLDHLGEHTTDADHARVVRDAYLDLIARLQAAGLTAAGRSEVSVKLSAVGQALGADGQKIATEHAREICRAAQAAGTTVTLDMEDHTTTDSTLAVLRELRADFPWVGAVLQAYLRRTEADCRDLATAGSRVRLCKGAYAEPASVAWPDQHDVDRSYVRCAEVLMAGHGHPMLATHDPRLVAVGETLAGRYGRRPGQYEFQMLYGVRPDEQRRLARHRHTVRVYLPYGTQWYGYLMRRMAERPANVAFFLRALATRG